MQEASYLQFLPKCQGMLYFSCVSCMYVIGIFITSYPEPLNGFTLIYSFILKCCLLYVFKLTILLLFTFLSRFKPTSAYKKHPYR